MGTDVLGVPVSAVNLQSAVAVVLGWIEHQEEGYVVVTDVHVVVRSQADGYLPPSGYGGPDGML